MQLACSMRLEPARQRLFDNPEAAGCLRNALAGLHHAHRLLLELKRVSLPRYLNHLHFPFAV